MAAICKQCGAATNRVARAHYCFPCSKTRSKTRIALADKRPGFAPLKVGGQWVCVDCGIPTKKRSGTRPALRCARCWTVRDVQLEFLSGKRTAAQAVFNAKKAGLLAPATAFKCADCDQPAECYDHRDYGRPLDVDPVCRSCNAMRGSALPINPFVVSFLILANEYHTTDKPTSANGR